MREREIREKRIARRAWARIEEKELEDLERYKRRKFNKAEIEIWEFCVKGMQFKAKNFISFTPLAFLSVLQYSTHGDVSREHFKNA